MRCPVGRGEDQQKKVREHEDAATHIRKCHSRSHMLSNMSRIPRRGCRSLSPHYQVWFVCKAYEGGRGEKASEGEKEKGKGKKVDKGKGKAMEDENENEESAPADPGSVMKYLGFDPAAEVRRGTYHPEKGTHIAIRWTVTDNGRPSRMALVCPSLGNVIDQMLQHIIERARHMQ